MRADTQVHHAVVQGDRVADHGEIGIELGVDEKTSADPRQRTAAQGADAAHRKRPDMMPAPLYVVVPA